MRTCLALIFALACAAAGSSSAAEITTDVPAKIDPAHKYLFFLHGLSVEMQGPDSYSQRFRKTYETSALARAFAERGFNVIAETRPKDASVPLYSRKIASQVRRLLDAGVPPRHIAVVGHSKGGLIALVAAGHIALPEMSFVILAGCPLVNTRIAGNDTRAGYERIISANKERIKGRVLSLYDVTDEWMGSCREAFADHAGLTTREVVLKTGLPPGMGHGLFYTPEKVWMDVTLGWIAE